MIERNINETILNREPSSKALVDILMSIDAKKDIGQCALYHHFPLYPNVATDKLITANLLFCSQKYGISIFKCIDFSNRLDLDVDEITGELDEIDRLVYAKILKDGPNLRQGRRELKVKIRSFVFFNNYTHSPQQPLHFDDFIILKSHTEVEAIIKSERNDLSESEYKDLKATIEGSKGLPKPIIRNLQSQSVKSKGAILTQIDNQICNFDLEQKRAALLTLDGAQRIRGLAGSGKTIILAMKAAMIHLQNSDAEILYTYYTKALHDVVKRLITRFYRQFADKDPDWRKIHIMHAWGGKGLEGVYYNACIANSVPTINLSEARSQSKKEPFDFVCEILNKQTLEPFYDYTLLDEAQDFPSTFYRVCRQLTKMNRVVWAYDDFQNILHVEMQSEKETFGKDLKGNWFIDFDKTDDELQDIVLHQCYRNPRKILITAFALGLGIYNTDEHGHVKIIQRLESNEHWQSLGFEVETGNSHHGDKMLIGRSQHNSPLLKNELLDDENDIIRILAFSNLSDECSKVVDMILDDLNNELNPEDISVICLDNMNYKLYFSNISSALREKGYKIFNLMSAPNDNTIFRVPGHVSLSSIFKAKGNEAGSVYVVGIDTVFSASGVNDITERNKIFTAMTRAQGWVTLTGTGTESTDRCIKEFNLLKENHFKLRFIQPSEEEVNTIRQDISKKQSVLNKMERIAEDLANELGLSKETVIEDLKNKMSKK